MRTAERRIWGRIRRRLASDRGSVFLEFAFAAAFFLPLICFAADFGRILFAEQQLEIGARAMADVESHLRRHQLGDTDDEWGGDDARGSKGRPQPLTKAVVRSYLVNVLSRNGFPKDGSGGDRVYMRAVDPKVNMEANPVRQRFLDWAKPFEKLSEQSFIMKIISLIIRGGRKVLMFGSDVYVTETFNADRYVGCSVSVKLQSVIANESAWRLFGRMTSEEGLIMLPQYAPEREGDGLSTTSRRRYYCFLPYMDSGALAPQTPIRKMAWFYKNWLK